MKEAVFKRIAASAGRTNANPRRKTRFYLTVPLAAALAVCGFALQGAAGNAQTPDKGRQAQEPRIELAQRFERGGGGGGGNRGGGGARMAPGGGGGGRMFNRGGGGGGPRIAPGGGERHFNRGGGGGNRPVLQRGGEARRGIERGMRNPWRGGDNDRRIVRRGRDHGGDIRRGDLSERWNRGRVRRHGRHFVWGSGIDFWFYDGYYYGDCNWLHRRAVVTGSRYWWRRYRLCRYSSW